MQPELTKGEAELISHVKNHGRIVGINHSLEHVIFHGLASGIVRKVASCGLVYYRPA